MSYDPIGATRFLRSIFGPSKRNSLENASPDELRKEVRDYRKLLTDLEPKTRKAIEKAVKEVRDVNEKENAALAQENDKKQAAVDLATTTIQGLKSKLQQQQEENQTISAKLEKLYKKHKIQTNRKRQLKKNFTTVNKELEQAKAELQAAVAQRDEARENAAKASKKSTAEHKEAISALSTLEASHETLVEQYAELESEKVNCERIISRLDRENNDLLAEREAASSLLPLPASPSVYEQSLDLELAAAGIDDAYYDASSEAGVGDEPEEKQDDYNVQIPIQSNPLQEWLEGTKKIDPNSFKTSDTGGWTKQPLMFEKLKLKRGKEYIIATVKRSGGDNHITMILEDFMPLLLKFRIQTASVPYLNALIQEPGITMTTKHSNDLYRLQPMDIVTLRAQKPNA